MQRHPSDRISLLFIKNLKLELSFTSWNKQEGAACTHSKCRSSPWARAAYQLLVSLLRSAGHVTCCWLYSPEHLCRTGTQFMADEWWWECYPFYQKIKLIGLFGMRTGWLSFGLDLGRRDAGSYRGGKGKCMLFHIERKEQLPFHL